MVRLPLTPAEVERGQRLGALLRRARGERSMLETALDACVSPETLRKIETGRVATPAFSTVAAIADVLGLSLDTVWAEINQPERGVEPTGSGHNARERLAS
jgi:transcriptional regulator with XRE-family HTH domain